MTETLFTKIINGEIPADVVYEDAEVLAFCDINPQAPTHILIIPKKPIATVNDIEAEDAALVGKLFVVAGKIAADAGIAEEGYRLVVNCNAAAGQTVFHLHMHLLAGRQLSWPPG